MDLFGSPVFRSVVVSQNAAAKTEAVEMFQEALIPAPPRFHPQHSYFPRREELGVDVPVRQNLENGVRSSPFALRHRCSAKQNIAARMTSQGGSRFEEMARALLAEISSLFGLAVRSASDGAA